MSDVASTRLPDFVIIGAMKAGTTTLFRWLADHPGCRLPAVKEPHFFALEEEYSRGLDAYRALFAGIGEDSVTGEASAFYSDPRHSEAVAARMHAALPHARLVYLVRHPEERLKSHYLHQWQRSRERRPLAEALEDDQNPYVALSCYADALRPFVERWGADAVLLLHLEELSDAEAPGWRRVTDFLGLAPAVGADRRENSTSTKLAYTPVLLRLWETGWLQRAKRLPAPVRRGARRVLGRPTGALRGQALDVGAVVLPEPVRDRLAEQWEGVHALVGTTAPPLAWSGERLP